MILWKPLILLSITLVCQPKVNPEILMQDCTTAKLPIIASIPADWLFLHQWLKLGTAGPSELEFNNSQLSETSWRSMFLSKMGERNSDSSPSPIPCSSPPKEHVSASETEETVSWESFLLWGHVHFLLLSNCCNTETAMLTA